MGTRWRKFKYGTEEKNPVWSFYVTIICLGLVLVVCAYAEYSSDFSVWACSFGFGALALASLAHLNLTLDNEKKCAVPIRIMDRKCPDLILLVFLAVLLLRWKSLWRIYYTAVGDILNLLNDAEMVFLGAVLIFLVVLLPIVPAVYFQMSVTRHLLNESLIKSLFLYRLLGLAGREIKKLRERWNCYRTESVRKGEAIKRWNRRQKLLAFVQFAVISIFLRYVGAYYSSEDRAFLLFLVMTVLFLFRFLIEMFAARDLGIVLKEIRHMAEDSFIQETPKLSPYSLFRPAEEELLFIQKNRKESMEKQLQSERMKVDLITNVSHDLNTPLTSMIGCIDLLKQTEGLSEEAGDYVRLLSAKAEKLKEMVQDVFDMARATSGGQDMNIERLDMTRLIRQTMADMQDRIAASELIFRVKMDEGELPFMGDGKKLYRVYQNLIENTLKYSMAGSRVYVEVQRTGAEIITSIKNTSDYEMDFGPEEIMERFTRGDKSRSTEGNGLGLAIAKSFTEACGGSFRLTLDGDLFKAETSFDCLCLSEE